MDLEEEPTCTTEQNSNPVTIADLRIGNPNAKM